jgi:hypothetical protein
MTTRKYKKSYKKINYKGGADFGAVSHIPGNPYTTYDVNPYNNDPSRDIQSARNIVGGKKMKKNKTKKNYKKSKKGGSYTPLKYDDFRPLLV